MRKMSPAPKYRILEIVTAHEVDGSLAANSATASEVVCTEIREIPDGTYKYAVAPLTEETAIGGIYSESQLTATGRVADLSRFISEGKYERGDQVVVLNDDDELTAGTLAHILAIDEDTDGRIYVTIETEHGEIHLVQETDIEATGSSKDLPEQTNSSSISVDTEGNVLGETRYRIVDRIEAHMRRHRDGSVIQTDPGRC